MNTLMNLKKQFSKIFVVMIALGLTVGCASVTDANLEQSDDIEQLRSADDRNTAVNFDNADNNIWLDSTGDDMSPIIDEPDMSDM